MLHKLLAETIGTFVLVFAGTGAIMVNAISHGAVTHVGIAMTFGLVVLALIYALGEVSGAHFNPAVTVAFWVSGRFPAERILPYCLSQIIGGALASLMLRLSLGNVAYLGATLPAGSAGQAFIFEVFLTAILMFVILRVSIGPKESGIVAGIAIGAVVGLEALFAGPITGASMNPVRSFAPALVAGHFDSLWIYLTAPFVGAIVSVPLSWLTTGQPASMKGA